MKIAIIGSRNLNIDISGYIPGGASLIVSGGARGIDALAEAYADTMNIQKLIIKPEYEKYGRAAPIKRNEVIVSLADLIIAFWDKKSRGTKYVIDYALKMEKPVNVHIIEQ
jgi:predicted Rossmann fold nucleotide-binding protein DprA/Smf involved in DNA uptake